VNFIPAYKTFMGIEKFSKKKCGNKVLMKVGTNSCVITYYNPYYYGSQEYYDAKQTFFFNILE